MLCHCSHINALLLSAFLNGIVNMRLFFYDAGAGHIYVNRKVSHRRLLPSAGLRASESPDRGCASPGVDFRSQAHPVSHPCHADNDSLSAETVRISPSTFMTLRQITGFIRLLHRPPGWPGGRCSVRPEMPPPCYAAHAPVLTTNGRQRMTPRPGLHCSALRHPSGSPRC